MQFFLSPLTVQFYLLRKKFGASQPTWARKKAKSRGSKIWPPNNHFLDDSRGVSRIFFSFFFWIQIFLAKLIFIGFLGHFFRNLAKIFLKWHCRCRFRAFQAWKWVIPPRKVWMIKYAYFFLSHPKAKTVKFVPLCYSKTRMVFLEAMKIVFYSSRRISKAPPESHCVPQPFEILGSSVPRRFISFLL